MSINNYVVTRDFFIHEKLGSGTYGDVYNGVSRCDNHSKAIKIFKMDNDEFDVSIINEIAILMRLKHPNIIEIESVYIWKKRDKYKIAFTMPRLNLLTTWIRRKAMISSSDHMKNIESAMRQLTSAILYLHTNGFIHQDIKPQNILINDYGVVKLIDFGISNFIGNCKTEICRKNGEIQSLNYRAPELLHHGQCYYNNNIDSWALGCVFVELLSHNTMLFNGNTPNHIEKDIQSANYVKFIKSNLPEYSDILLSIINPLPNKRLRINHFARKIGIKFPRSLRKVNIRHLMNYTHPIHISKCVSHPHILNTILSFSIAEGYHYRSFAGAVLMYRLVAERFSESVHTTIGVMCLYISTGVYEGMQSSLESVKYFLKKHVKISVENDYLLDCVIKILKYLDWNIIFAFPTDFINKATTTDELLTLILLYNVDYTVYPSYIIAKSIQSFTAFHADDTEYGEFIMSSLASVSEMRNHGLFGPELIYSAELKKILD